MRARPRQQHRRDQELARSHDATLIRRRSDATLILVIVARELLGRRALLVREVRLRGLRAVLSMVSAPPFALALVVVTVTARRVLLVRVVAAPAVRRLVLAALLVDVAHGVPPKKRRDVATFTPPESPQKPDIGRRRSSRCLRRGSMPVPRRWPWRPRDLGRRRAGDLGQRAGGALVQRLAPGRIEIVVQRLDE